MQRGWVLPAALSAALAVVVAGCGGGAGGTAGGGGVGGGGTKAAGDGEPLRVGLLLALSGPAAPFGLPERDAAEAAAKQINEDGGVGGRKIELSVYDDGSEPTECARGATTLIREKKVLAIIGGTTGSCTLAAAPVAAREKVAMLAPNGTIEVTDKEKSFYPYVFRTASNDLLNTKEVFDRAVADGAKRIAVFYQEDAYGENTADYIDKLAGEKGIDVVAKASAPLTATDVSAQASRLRNGDPEAVLMQVSSPKLGGAFVRAAHEVGLKAIAWGGIGLAQRSFVDASGAAGEGVHLVAFGNPYTPGGNAQKLLPLLPKQQLEGFAELLSTNGMLAISEAAKKAGDTLDSQSLRDGLESLCGVKTYSEGELCYAADNHDGWGANSLVTTVIKGGKLETEQ